MKLNLLEIEFVCVWKLPLLLEISWIDLNFISKQFYSIREKKFSLLLKRKKKYENIAA